ncbi:hypothetical protein HYDPIDRAFT_112599 [Hydnomerulius pinastri MD-312]|uniref:Uncharacterized protein n=1 Tax=Hydnomerulius pinastri MD-312 TaxID=994086 RepID=A0A0C9W017_9AGAM|nr:hypothetical protein HYDPIDRAFT_112599 [Hydnomerulius pinastri MD-312]
MEELPAAAAERARLDALLSQPNQSIVERERIEIPLSKHLLHGLAYTVGSALGSDPPTREECLSAFLVLPNKSRLTAGARAWAKHAHRSQGDTEGESAGWWGKQPTGPVAGINERALLLFDKVMDNVSWRNLHWLPHQVLVYEARVEDGYGMRWSQDRGKLEVSAGKTQDGEGEPNTITSSELSAIVPEPPWIFRGFVEPMMENGHEVGWRH